MEGVKTQLDALFNSAGKHYEVLVYELNRVQGEVRNGAETPTVREERINIQIDVLQDLLTALAPFKERITKINKYDL